jgi:NAD(P)H-flavin reductase
LAHYQFDGGQYILTLASDTIAKATKPGQFVHITVSDSLAMRRLYIRCGLCFANRNQSYSLSVINLINPRLNFQNGATFVRIGADIFGKRD